MTQQTLLIDDSQVLAQIPRNYTHGQQINLKDYIPHAGDFVVAVGDECATGFVSEQEGEWLVGDDKLAGNFGSVIIIQ